jgi:Fic family protein
MEPYNPQALPLPSLDWSQLILLLGKANRSIALYDGLLQSVINPDVLLTPLRTQEAVFSSKIEGTQATLEEVLEYEAEAWGSHYKRGEVQEVLNYRQALIHGKKLLSERPLSLNLVKQMHNLLMQGVRGGSKDPGEFRRIQNWIGPPRSTLEQARFVPPTVPVMMEGLYNWESYLHAEEKDPLVQLAVVHAQFEILHPFMDGNGRIGRMLIPLFLYHKGIIHQPVFYMSHFLEEHRQEYYDRLKAITDEQAWEDWIQFFLMGIIQQAEKNTQQTKTIMALYDEMKTVMATQTHSQWSIQCLDFIFSHPIFNTSDFVRESTVPKTSAARLLRSMEESHIITCLHRGVGRRPSLFAFRRLLQVIND